MKVNTVEGTATKTRTRKAKTEAKPQPKKRVKKTWEQRFPTPDDILAEQQRQQAAHEAMSEQGSPTISLLDSLIGSFVDNDIVNKAMGVIGKRLDNLIKDDSSKPVYTAKVYLKHSVTPLIKDNCKHVFTVSNDTVLCIVVYTDESNTKHKVICIPMANVEYYETANK